MSLDAAIVRFPTLNDTNYWEWVLRMEALLVKRKLWKVVQPKLTPPASVKPEDVEAWEKALLDARDVDLMAEARAEIVERVDTSQLAHVRDPDPKVIWETLRQAHVALGFATRLSLRREFLHLKKDPDENMTSWIGRVKALAFRLKDAGIRVEDEDQILALTNGLDPSFEAFVVSLDATPDDTMTLAHVTKRLLNEEIRRKNDEVGRPREGALVVAGGSSQRFRQGAPVLAQPGNGPPSCWKCGQPGHIRAFCKEVPNQGTPMGVAQVAVTPADTFDMNVMKLHDFGHTVI